MPKSVLAVLAGASVFAPPDQALPEPVFDNAVFDPGGEQQPMLIRAQYGAASMTIYPTENLSNRGDVSIYDTEYQFNLVVQVPYSGDGYRPYGGFQGRSDLDATVLHALVPQTGSSAIWWPGTSCLVNEYANNINWTTTASSVTLSFHVDRAKFDAARASSSGPIVLKGWLGASSACPRTSSTAPSTSSDDDK